MSTRIINISLNFICSDCTLAVDKLVLVKEHMRTRIKNFLDVQIVR
jgi:hypothetical protein